jgi:hypothetical protein
VDNSILKVNDSGLKSELEKMFSKVKVLVENYNGLKDETEVLMEKLKSVEQALSDTKIDISNRNSDLLNKDKEITELKNKMLDERKNKISGEDKTQLKQRIRELMVRLDTHLEQKANNNF